MTTDLIPVVDRPAEAPIARLAGRRVSTAEFCAQVHAVAERLPAATHILNLVEDRYAFSVAFAAIVMAGKCNVLPASPKPAVQAEIAAHFDTAAVLHDGIDVAPGLPERALALRDVNGAAAVSLPPVAADHIAGIAFTSGSTGAAKPVAKSWRMFRGAVAAYASDFLPAGSQVVATVPSHHMYGLELCSLQPLWTAGNIPEGKPLYPADVAAALAALDGPRVLITTPLHLQALVDSGVSFAPVERVLCATAPLTPALAASVERAFAAPLIDVYGCSEAGCMATRRLTSAAAWRPIPGFDFTIAADGRTVVDGAHMDEPVELSDRLEPAGDGTFHLVGRFGDLINVAGKRASLGDITRRLLDTPGVEDAVALAPDAEQGNARVAAIYAGTATTAEVRASLRRHLDDVLLPRPLVQVDRLPRSATSKLVRADLQAILAAHKRA